MANPSFYNGVPVVNTNDPSNVIPATLINSYSALTVPAYFRALNVISSALSGFPRSVHKGGSVLQVKHPLDTFLQRRPNEYQTQTPFWRTLFYQAAHQGNGYARIERTLSGAVIALHNLPEDVFPFRFDKKDGNGIQQYYGHTATKEVWPGADVIHLAALGHDGMSGFDPVTLMGETFLRAKTISRYQTKYLMKGTVMRGAIQIPKKITQEQRAQIESLLRSKFQGADADQDILILDDAATLNNATVNANDSQLIPMAAFNTKEISQITGVPPQLLFELGESKYVNTVEAMGQDLVRNCLMPWIIQTEEELTAKLLTDAEQNQEMTVHLDPSALLRGDATTQSNILVAQVRGGIRTANEARAVLDLPKDTDPASDKLKMAGDTAPPAIVDSQKPPKESSATPGKAFSALQPVIDAAVARIETKTAKAFESKAGKPPDERTIWVNVFAEQQSAFVRESFSPIAATIAEMTGRVIPVDEIAVRYAQQVRQRAADGNHKPLATIIEDMIHEKAA